MRIALMLLLLAAEGLAQIPEQGAPPKNLAKRADGHFTANNDAVNVENFEVHVVVSGDTLSAISGTVLKDARLWPQLWEDNDHIVNPHWIYPNDVILIRPVVRIGDATPPPAPVPAPPPPPPPPAAPKTPFPLNVAPAPQNDAPPRPAFDLAPPRTFPQIKAGDVQCAGFIRAAEVDNDMPVIARFNSDSGILAAESEYIYLGRGTQDGVKAGATYQVIRPTRDVKSANAERDKNRGKHYLNIAEVRIVLVQPEYSLARVIQNCEAIEVGDFLIPSEALTVPTLTEKRPFSPTMMASGQMRGWVITTKDALSGYGSGLKLSGRLPGIERGDLAKGNHGYVNEGGIVYVDVGRNEAVRPGDVFIVFRNVDVEDLAPSPGRGIVREQRTAIGELVILKVEDLASSAFVTYSTDGIALGDSVERR